MLITPEFITIIGSRYKKKKSTVDHFQRTYTKHRAHSIAINIIFAVQKTDGLNEKKKKKKEIGSKK